MCVLCDNEDTEATLEASENPPPSRLCSPLAAAEGPAVAVVNAWCSPLLTSPAGRSLTMIELSALQSSPRVDISDPFVKEKEFDEEAMVLASIARQTEEEEEMEEDNGSRRGDLFAGGYGDEDEDEAPEWRSAAHPVRAETGSATKKHASTRHFAITPLDSPPVMTSTALAKSVTTLAASATSVQPSLPASGTMKERQDAHWWMASESGHAGFKCSCSVARARCASSCIDRFSKEQFRRWHNETYGVTATGAAATPTELDVQTSIHAKMWQLKEELDTKGNALDDHGRKYTINTWKLDGHEVRRTPRNELRTHLCVHN